MSEKKVGIVMGSDSDCDNHIQCHHADHSIIYIISLLSIDNVEDAPDK